MNSGSMSTGRKLSIVDVVSAGVEFLNNHFGNYSWINNIDLNKLDLSSSSDCILGQLFGCYWRALTELELETGNATRLGFSHDATLVEGTFDALTKEWIERINNLLYAQNNASSATHTFNITVGITLTTEQIGRIYLDAKERGISVEEYLQNEVSYKAEGLDF